MGGFGYRKSRNGCVLCKKRRVKCDEKRPCSACRKNGVQCSLTIPGTAAVRARSSQSPRSSSVSAARAPSQKADPGFPSSLDTVSGSTGIMDLELMHHWTTVTSAAIPGSPTSCHVFMHDVPRLALRFPYLLHQLLAMAAFHIMHLRPETAIEYGERGSHHQSLSISGMREALSSDMTADNSTALSLTSGILMASTFASHLDHERLLGPSCPLAGVLEKFSLLRGMSALHNLATERLSSHPLQQLFDAGDFTKGDASLIDSIRGRLETVRPQLLAAAAFDKDVIAVVDSGVVSLSRILVNTHRRIIETRELKVVFSWPVVMSDEFLGLLHARNPAALTVFMYYCIALRVSEPNCWFLGGWALKLTASISDTLANSPWAELIEWPLERIRQHGLEEVKIILNGCN